MILIALDVGRGHGELCNKPIKCRNCGDDHHTTSKLCPLYQINREIKVVIAYNNCSFFEADRILQESGNNSVHYDRYVEPKS